MNCGCELLTGGIEIGCENFIGGIQTIYLTEKCNVSSIALSSPGGEISAFTMVASALFYEFQFNKDTSNYTEVYTRNPTGANLFTQTVTLLLKGREKTKRDTLALILNNKDLVAIVRDSNNILWYLGAGSGLNVTENNGASGTAKADFNGYTVTLMAEEANQANTVLESALTAVI